MSNLKNQRIREVLSRLGGNEVDVDEIGRALLGLYGEWWSDSEIEDALLEVKMEDKCSLTPQSLPNLW